MCERETKQEWMNKQRKGWRQRQREKQSERGSDVYFLGVLPDFV